MKLGAVLKHHRQIADLTVRQLAAEIGVGPGTICRIENGESISAETLMKVMNWLFRETKQGETN